MKSTDIPAKIPVPFASSAIAGTSRTVPVPSQIGITDGAASFTTGFPPKTQEPIASGGVPPFGQDMNGVLNAATGWAQWYAAGGPQPYDSTFAAALYPTPGYPKGAVVASVTTPGAFWLSTIDDNTNNPDTGGAGWINIFGPTYRLIQNLPILGSPTTLTFTGLAITDAFLFWNGVAATGAATSINVAFSTDNGATWTASVSTSSSGTPFFTSPSYSIFELAGLSTGILTMFCPWHSSVNINVTPKAQPVQGTDVGMVQFAPAVPINGIRFSLFSGAAFANTGALQLWGR